MTAWHIPFSLFAIILMYYSVWQIETYPGRCGNPVVNWIITSLFVGSIGANLALNNLSKRWEHPGKLHAVYRIIDLTLIVEFMIFLLWYVMVPLVIGLSYFLFQLVMYYL